MLRLQFLKHLGGFFAAKERQLVDRKISGQENKESRLAIFLSFRVTDTFGCEIDFPRLCKEEMRVIDYV